MELTASNVDTIMRDCLFKEEEVVTPGQLPEGGIVAEGVIQKFGFNPQRLESHRAEVREMLSQLPDEFIAGGGWSFLNACVRKDGEQWGEHMSIEALFALGNALGLVTYPLPREMWGALPGGMPYVTVKLEKAA